VGHVRRIAGQRGGELRNPVENAGLARARWMVEIVKVHDRAVVHGQHHGAFGQRSGRPPRQGIGQRQHDPAEPIEQFQVFAERNQIVAGVGVVQHVDRMPGQDDEAIGHC